MDSLYELCKQRAELAPEESSLEHSGVHFRLSHNGGLFCSQDDLDTDPDVWWPQIVRSVCYWLQCRSKTKDIGFSLSYLDGEYDATIFNYSADPFALYEAERMATPAHALLGAYVEYLKANRE